MSNAIPTQFESFVIDGNLTVTHSSLDPQHTGSIEALNTIYSDKLSEYNTAQGISIINTQGVTNSTTASIVFYGGASFLKESRHSSYLDISQTSQPSAPNTGTQRLFVNSSNNTICVLKSDNNLSTLNPLTTKGDIFVHNSTTDISLPVGSNGQFLSANSTQASGLEWTTLSVAYVKDVKTTNTNGGTFTSGSWVVRTLNTLEGNANSRVSLSSNQITLQPGKYNITATAPGHFVNSHQTRLFNVTDNVVETLGSSEAAGGGGLLSTPNCTRSHLACFINISTAKVYRLEHRCTTTRTTDGLGVASGFNNEVYSIVSIQVLE